MAINFDKLQQQAPELVSLAKTAQVSLEKKNMSAHQARVALVLDISGSMMNLYRHGQVQTLAEKILALGLHFDDNGAIDVFLFNTAAHEHGEMTLDNFRGFMNTVNVSGGTNYAPIMKMVREHYFGTTEKQSSGGLKKLFGRKETPAAATTTPMQPQQPAYVMFVTDGEPGDHANAEQEVRLSSELGLFWQFMAIGDERNFSFLTGLDNMNGRKLDNANFFAVNNPETINDTELFDKLMSEYPTWVQQAKNLNMIV